MGDSHYQSISRAIILPSFPLESTLEAPEDFLRRQFRTLAENYSRLAAEVVNCHNQILVEQEAVTAGAVTLTWVLPAPYYDANYSVSALPSWNTVVWFSGQTRTQIVLNFSAAAPGGGGTLLLKAIR